MSDARILRLRDGIQRETCRHAFAAAVLSCLGVRERVAGRFGYASRSRVISGCLR